MTPQPIILTWDKVDAAVKVLAKVLEGKEYDVIVGIERGGLIPAALVHRYFPKAYFEGVHAACELRYAFNPDQRILLVDDIWDSGKTLRNLTKEAEGYFTALDTCTLVTKDPNPSSNYYGLNYSNFGWITFPWEEHGK